MECSIKGVKPLIDGVGFGVWGVDSWEQACHGVLCGGDGVVASCFFTGDDGTGDGGSEGAGLRASGDFHGSACDVGVDLHDERIFFGDAAAVDDLSDLDAEFFKSFDDREGAEGGGFDQGAIDFGRGGVERLAQEQSCEFLIDEDGAIAVVPVEGEQARFAGFEFGGLSGEIFVRAEVLTAGLEDVDEPVEDIADGGLPGFEAEVSGEDAAGDDAAEARDIGKRRGRSGDHHIAGAGADDLDERAGGDTRADSSEMGVECACCDGDIGGQSQTFCPLVGQ